MTSAELSSMATALDELARRISALADDHARSQRDDVAAELYEVERALGVAHRRLVKLVESPRR